MGRAICTLLWLPWAAFLVTSCASHTREAPSPVASSSTPSTVSASAPGMVGAGERSAIILREDFKHIVSGDVPRGWTGAENVMVRDGMLLPARPGAIELQIPSVVFPEHFRVRVVVRQVPRQRDEDADLIFRIGSLEAGFVPTGNGVSLAFFKPFIGAGSRYNNSSRFEIPASVWRHGVEVTLEMRAQMVRLLVDGEESMAVPYQGSLAGTQGLTLVLFEAKTRKATINSRTANIALELVEVTQLPAGEPLREKGRRVFFREDFAAVPLGNSPVGWLVGSQDLGCVRDSSGKKALGFLRSPKIPPATVLRIPDIRLPDNFEMTWVSERLSEEQGCASFMKLGQMRAGLLPDSIAAGLGYFQDRTVRASIVMAREYGDWPETGEEYSCYGNRPKPMRVTVRKVGDVFTLLVDGKERTFAREKGVDLDRGFGLVVDGLLRKIEGIDLDAAQ